MKTSLRAEQRNLREKMRALGLSHRQIAVEFTRRYGLRPRAAWRHAFGWSLKDAAEQINSRAADTGVDPAGNAAMTGPHLCEYENWPGPGPKPVGRRPTPLVLALLAATYNTPDVHDPLDFADYEHIPPADRLVLDASVCAEEQGGSDIQLKAQGQRLTSTTHAGQPPRPGQLVALSMPRPAPYAPYGWQADRVAGVPPGLAPLASALLSPPCSEPDASPDRLADEAVRIWKLRQAAQYQRLTDDLPRALTRARSNESAPAADRSATALAALTHLSRVRGDYDKAMTGVRAFGEAGLPISLSAVVLRSTMHALGYLCQIADVLDAGKLKLILPLRKGNALGLPEREFITVDEARDAFGRLTERRATHDWWASGSEQPASTALLRRLAWSRSPTWT